MTQAAALAELPDEPLAESAPMARQLAAKYCAGHAGEDSCDNYHGFWQYLRLMNLGPALGGHAVEYVRAMAELARQWEQQSTVSSKRVLISGCADYSMLAHVRHAFSHAASPPAITVLDICPTPLKLCVWYAQRVGLPVETVCSDLLAYRPSDGYDLIVTSSFLGFFSPNTRPRLFEAYAAMLRPQGRLVFSNRLRPGPESVQTSFTASQALRFADKVAQSCQHLPPQAALTEQDAHRMALSYATLRRPYPVNSVETLRPLAAFAGLDLERAWTLRSAVAPGEISGPTLGDGSAYLFVVMRKPGTAALQCRP